MTTRTDFRAYTAHGALIHTFGDRDQAEAWAERDGDRYPGYVLVEHIETITVRERRIGRRLPVVDADHASARPPAVPALGGA